MTLETQYKNIFDSTDYVIISPCRNEEKFMRRTLNSVIAQSIRPALWVIVNDGSTDSTGEILAEYAAKHDFIRVVDNVDRGFRKVGAGVVEAFQAGFNTINLDDYEFICKLDLDLDLPEKYFQRLMERMQENPRVGTCSGKPYYKDSSGNFISEGIGDEMSVGASKFIRRACFQELGGFVLEVMWDAIDCHSARQMGWIVVSWDEPDLRFEHLRPMGSSQKGILTGRARHGYGQYFMGSDPLYFFATAVFRMKYRPFVVGGISMLFGFVKSAVQRNPRYEAPGFRDFVRKYQRRALFVGKSKATQEIETAAEQTWLAKYSTNL